MQRCPRGNAVHAWDGGYDEEPDESRFGHDHGGDEESNRVKPVRSNWMFSLQWFLATAGGLVIGFGLMFVGISVRSSTTAASFCFRLGARKFQLGLHIWYSPVAWCSEIILLVPLGGFYLHVLHGEFSGLYTSCR